MKSTGEYIKLLQSFKRQLAKEYGITRVGIFGSVARGEQTEHSDVDICIESGSMGLFAFSRLHLNLEKLFGKSVDVVRLSQNMNPRFRQQIEKDVIYV
jgi:predicted nucleotidyltransferase